MVDTSIVLGPASGFHFLYGVASNGEGWRVLWANDNDYSVRTNGIGPDGSLLDSEGIPAGQYQSAMSLQSRAIAGTGEGFVAVWPLGSFGIRAAMLDSAGSPLDTFLVFTSDSGQSDPAVAFDGDSTCLVAWTESPNGDGDIYAARVTTGGRVLDTTPIPIAEDPLESEMLPCVAYGESVFLVTWTALGAGAAAKAVRVSRDGAVLDTATFLRHSPATDQAYPTVAFGDSCFLVAWSEGMAQPDMFAARVSTAGALIDSAVQLSDSPNYDMLASVGFDGTRYLVMWCDLDINTYWASLCGRRLTADCVALDSGMIRPELSGYSCMYPSVAADGANFLVGLTTQDTLSYVNGACCLRISPDGAVLDSGIFLPLGADAQSGPSGTSDGTDFLAAWLETRSQGQAVHAARISADGTVLDPIGFPVNDAPGQKYNLATGFGDSLYLVAWADYRGVDGPDIYCARVSREGAVLDSTGIVVCAAMSYQDVPDISFDGQNFLVVWTDSRSQVTNNIYAARVSRAGVVLDPDGFVVAAADTFDDAQPAVCFAGTDYLVVWPGMNMNVYESRVYGALVSPAGLVTKPRFVVGGAENYQNSPSVASGPTNSLVAWEAGYDIYAARVRADGTVLDPSGLPVAGTSYDEQMPRVTSDEAGFRVLWHRWEYTDSTIFAAARVDTAGNVSHVGDWFGMPGSDNGFDAVYGSGPELLLLFSCWTDTALGRYYGADRLWGRFGQVPGIEQAGNGQQRNATGGATLVCGVLFLPPSLLSPPSSLLSIDGRKVMVLKPGANDVSRLSPGIYFVRKAQTQAVMKVIRAR